MCRSRALSLFQDNNFVASNEAQKCAGAIEGFDASFSSHLRKGPVAPFPGMDEPWPEEKKQELVKVLGEIFKWESR